MKLYRGIREMTQQREADVTDRYRAFQVFFQLTDDELFHFGCIKSSQDKRQGDKAAGCHSENLHQADHPGLQERMHMQVTALAVNHCKTVMFPWFLVKCQTRPY